MRLSAGAGNFLRKLFGINARRKAVQHHGISRTRERERNRAADTASRSGNQCHARRFGLVIRHRIYSGCVIDRRKRADSGTPLQYRVYVRQL